MKQTSKSKSKSKRIASLKSNTTSRTSAKATKVVATPKSTLPAFLLSTLKQAHESIEAKSGAYTGCGDGYAWRESRSGAVTDPRTIALLATAKVQRQAGIRSVNFVDNEDYPNVRIPQVVTPLHIDEEAGDPITNQIGQDDETAIDTDTELEAVPF